MHVAEIPAYLALTYSRDSESARKVSADHGAAFDRDLVNGQVEYQKGNAALSERRSRTAATLISSNSQLRPCQRSRIICSEP
jgi:hypothetical protein